MYNSRHHFSFPAGPYNAGTPGHCVMTIGASTSIHRPFHRYRPVPSEMIEKLKEENERSIQSFFLSMYPMLCTLMLSGIRRGNGLVCMTKESIYVQTKSMLLWMTFMDMEEYYISYAVTSKTHGWRGNEEGIDSLGRVERA